jgi:hypothetical protein
LGGPGAGKAKRCYGRENGGMFCFGLREGSDDGGRLAVRPGTYSCALVSLTRLYLWVPTTRVMALIVDSELRSS